MVRALNDIWIELSGAWHYLVLLLIAVKEVGVVETCFHLLYSAIRII